MSVCVRWGYGDVPIYLRCTSGISPVNLRYISRVSPPPRAASFGYLPALGRDCYGGVCGYVRWKFVFTRPRLRLSYLDECCHIECFGRVAGSRQGVGPAWAGAAQRVAC